MRTIAALLVAVPMLGAAQESAQPAAPAAQPQQASPPQQPPQYAPPPPPQYAPQGQYAPPPPQYAPQGQYPPPPAPHYPPQGQYAPPPQGYPPPLPGHARRDRQRDSWYIGFGAGGGDARIKIPEGTYSVDDFLGADATPISLTFKVGATLTPKLLLGFDLTSITASAKYATTIGNVTRSLSIVNLDAVATYFPMERGLFLRGGVGLAGITSILKTPGADTSDSLSGVNVLGGVGYAFWLGSAFNLTVGLDYSAQKYGGEGSAEGPDSSSFWTLGVGFDWY